MAPKNREHDGASPGKIFVGGLPRDTSHEDFVKHFEEYGAITDSVIMKDKNTRQPRGFGFITYANPADVDKVIVATHIFNGKQVEIKRTIPKGAAQAKDFKTKKIFVGGIPTAVTEDELKNFFSKYGKVAEHEIIRDHATKKSRGFGFVIFDSENVVDDLLANGNMIDLAGSQVEIKKAEPKKASNPAPSAFGSEPRARPLGGFGSSYGGFGDDYFPSSYRASGGLGPRLGEYGGYGSGAGEFGGGYGGYGGGIGGYRGESSLGYSGRIGSYGPGFGGDYGVGGLGGYGRDEGYRGYGGSSYGGGYDSGPGSSFGSGGPSYGGRGGGYGGGSGPTGRYHPYAR